MKRKMLLMLSVLLLLSWARPDAALSADQFWTCGSGSWTNGGCWDSGQPINGDSVYLHTDSITGGYTVAYDTDSYVSLINMYVGYTYTSGLPGTVTLEITAPNASIDVNILSVGWGGSGAVGYGAVAQSGGIVGSFDSTFATGTDLTLGVNSNDSGSYTLTGGSLYAGIETIGASGSGVFTHDGTTGSNNTTNYAHELYLGFGATGNGVYNLGAGELTSYIQYIGYDGTGEFTQSSPLNSYNTTNILILGNNSTGDGAYTMTGGWLTAGSEYIGYQGTGAFTQWGGLNSVSGGLSIGHDVGSSGEYSMMGALGGNPTLTVANDIYVGRYGDGTFTQDGGAVTATNEYIGYYSTGTGAFTQTDGSNTISNALYLGYMAGSYGTYDLNGTSWTTSVTATDEYIGYNGTGAFTQTNGSNTVSNALYLGYGAGSDGTYDLSASGWWFASALSAGAELVGHDGKGTFNQSGGTNSVSTNLYVGSGSGTGEYNLSGGYLTAYNEEIGTGTGSGVFNQTGGYNTVSGVLTIGANGIYNLNSAQTNVGFTELMAGSIVNNGVINYSDSGGYGSITANGGNICSYCGNYDPNATTFENNGSLNISGAIAKTIRGNITNNGTVNADNTTVTFNDPWNGTFTNNGTVNVVNSTVTFNGTFTNNGAYISDPSNNYFSDLIVGATGYFTGGAGDNFYIAGDFMNYSTQTSLWYTADSYLGFTGTSAHEFYLAGWDSASSMSFLWDTLELGDGGSLLFNGGAGAALYVDNLILSAGSTINLNGFNLYYYSLTDLGGSYYNGQLINLASNTGGATVPEPSTLLLLGSGFIGLAAMRRFRKSL